MNDTMERAIATIELISVARGILAADAMLKAADVRLYEAHPICPGKYLVVVGGQVGAVEESLRAGVRIGREAVSDHMILPNVHPDVFRALAMATEPGNARAIGIVETMAALCVHLTAQEQQRFAQLLKAILACQERQDWLGLADYLAWEWADLLLSIDARLAETAEK